MKTPPTTDLSAWRTFTQQQNQGHLLAFADQLAPEQLQAFLAQLAEVEWEHLPTWIDEYVANKPDVSLPADLAPADFYPITPRDDAEAKLYADAEACGWELLRQGKVAAFTVAGGQGTRLGFDGPKGTYPVAPISGKTLFQWFAESLHRYGEIAGKPIPWYIMTSPMNDQDTRDYFADNDNLGLAPGQVTFFAQGTMPAFGPDGKLLLAAPDSLAMSPDGHGGSLKALFRSGATAAMATNGVEHISYFQVDNPLVSVVNPFFIGLHHLTHSDMSSRSLSKAGPHEKIGAFCRSGESLLIVEYSDLPNELAEATDADGNLRFLAGSPAIHVIRRDFIESLNQHGAFQLPFHRADKKVPCLDDSGNLTSPTEPNGVKLETFVFDALPLAKTTIIAEADRNDEFGPVKNATGVDSAESCRILMQERFARWLTEHGIDVPRHADGSLNCTIEISPALHISAADFTPADLDGLTIAPGESIHIS